MRSEWLLMHERDVDVFSEAEPGCGFAEAAAGAECCYGV